MRVFLLAALAVVLTLPASAQSVDPVERLTEALSLSADQADLVAEVYDERDPASTWTLAAELLPTLSDAQRQALMERPRGAEGGAQGQGGQGRRGSRGQGTRPRDPARQAVMQAARDAALGLDADQSARLDAALESIDRRAMAESLRDGVMPEALRDVLTAEQADLWQAQMMLQRRLRARGRRAPSDS